MKILPLIIVLCAIQIGTAVSFAKEGDDAPSPTILRAKLDGLIQNPVPITIQSIVDPLTVVDDTGIVYGLTGLDVPGMVSGDPKFIEKTKARLAQLTLKQKCTLFQTRRDTVGRINRMGQHVAQLVCGKDRVWIQGELVSEGLARVRTVPDNAEMAAALLEIEHKAREAKTGLWAESAFAVLTADNAAKGINGFNIVEGTIVAAAQKNNMVYLNFAQDWRNDFSIGIPSSLRSQLAKAHISPLSLQGRRVRVRGWITDYNGPFIEIDHAAQLEILGDGALSQGDSPTGGMNSISAPDVPQVDAPQPPEAPDAPEEKSGSTKAAEPSEVLDKVMDGLFNP